MSIHFSIPPLNFFMPRLRAASCFNFSAAAVSVISWLCSFVMKPPFFKNASVSRCNRSEFLRHFAGLWVVYGSIMLAPPVGCSFFATLLVLRLLVYLGRLPSR